MLKGKLEVYETKIRGWRKIGKAYNRYMWIIAEKSKQRERMDDNHVSKKAKYPRRKWMGMC
jgi:hypothetical protein